MPSTIFVDGLPPAFGSDRVRQLFAPYGKVLSALVSSPTRGHGSAFGFVEMLSSEEAAQAVNALRGTKILGHPIMAYLVLSRNSDGVEASALRSSHPSVPTSEGHLLSGYC